MDEKTNTKIYQNVQLGGQKSNEKGEGDSNHKRYDYPDKEELKGRN
jgi:hypothetical protein